MFIKEIKEGFDSPRLHQTPRSTAYRGHSLPFAFTTAGTNAGRHTSVYASTDLLGAKLWR